MKNLIIYLSVILSLFLFNSCLKDNPTTPPDLKFETSTQILDYLEQEGDYINSVNFPSLLTAGEVFNNLNSYYVIDIRTSAEFTAGHIENSINISPDSLLNYFKSNDTLSYKKVLLVSGTGQAASYFCCLLILDGYPNVYAMKYGMAAWNSVFSAPWTNALQDFEYQFFTTTVYPKADFTPLPAVSYPSNLSDAKSKVEYRISQLMSEGFDDNFKSSYSPPVADFDNTLPIDHLPNSYLICLGIPTFYVIFHGDLQHPYGAVSYEYYRNESELASAHYLQTIPSDKTIYIYSYSGQISAFITAYLRVLGYNAKSLLFGGNNIIYHQMLAAAFVKQYAFTQNDINDFPYVTGN